MFDNPYILPSILGLLVFFGYLAIAGVSSTNRNLQSRVNRLATATAGASQESQLLSLEEKRSFLAIMLEGMLKSIGFNTDLYRTNMQPRLAQAGFSNPDLAIYYLFYKRFLSIFFVFIGVYIIIQPAPSMLFKAMYGFAGGLTIILGIWGFDIWIKNQTVKRQLKLTRSFPDALDLLLVCVESGLALDSALSRVCKELTRAHPEIGFELNRTRLELALLNDRTQALQNLSARTGLQPFRSLVATLIQTEKFGTSLTETLRVLSDDYRLTRLMIAENKAGRLPALMTIPLICLMMPAFILIIMGPPMIKLFGEGGIVDK